MNGPEVLQIRVHRSAETAYPYRRVALHLAAGALTSAGFFLFCLASRLSGLCDLSSFALAAHATATAGLMTAWITVAQRLAGPPWIAWIERGAVLLSLTAYSAMSVSLEPALFPTNLLLLIACFALLGRSIAVPLRAADSLALVGTSSIAILAAFVARGSSVLELVLAASWLVAIATLSAGVSRLAWNLRGEIAKAERAGGYVLEQRLHEGPNAIVFRATHALLERPAAVKVLVPDDPAAPLPPSFTRGARLMARLSHAHSARVYDYGRSVEGSWYVAMELVDGITLEEAHAVDPSMPPERVVHIARQIASALAEAHELGLLHGAIAPRHLMLTQQGGEDDAVKVLDFGGRTTASDTSFRAPEVELGPHATDARADVYSVGAIARFLLGASPPSVELDALLASAVDPDPDRRPRSAREFARSLDEIAARRPWTRDDAMRWWRSNDAALRSCEAERA